ncbi:hypothetical protein CAI21_17485 [Alkalilimnicola ehrlichii]|uniref:Uncharacterized protein n=1 Tax=Alkalilimnicola ehrlichii TaxID=351052 RepID=A0A3E0WMQ2_9GAMM|nr:hypothetical protein [Alkalilimnicola ehrlichii]RFA26270.1 hypothetical protein CAI21_17485 [Alkalilimnicola ehrlichii]RFA33256.1 hypothetical protein CAL65_17970 [Alkalilimnicola ehrlichii]
MAGPTWGAEDVELCGIFGPVEASDLVAVIEAIRLSAECLVPVVAVVVGSVNTVLGYLSIREKLERRKQLRQSSETQLLDSVERAVNRLAGHLVALGVEKERAEEIGREAVAALVEEPASGDALLARLNQGRD